MKKVSFLSKIFLITGLFFSLYSCEDDHYARYEDPPWLSGSILETLEEKGNYTILLQLMKKAGYEEPIQNGLFTIMAANDSSYQAYFKSASISSVDEITEEQAFKLFTLNIMNTPKARQQFVYDYSYWHGGWQESGSEIGALLWRMQTQSKADDYFDTVRYFTDFKGETLLIQGQEKWVPYFSTEFFAESFGDPNGSDYNFFFPDTKWSGLQWYNANVLSSEAKCSNGYIYFIDKVVPGIPSIEEYVKENQDKYGVFYDLIQRFAYYSLSGYADDNDQVKIYSKGYSRITNIASEGGPTPDGGIIQRKNSWTALIPTNNALQNYIDNTILKQFSSLDEVPEITLTFLAQSCLVNRLVIPSKMQKQFFNYYGDVVPIDIHNDIESAIMLSNGPVYTMNKYNPPRAFTSTIAPVFFDSIYTTFLYGINASQMIISLTSPDLDVTIFAPTNDGLAEGGIRYFKEGERIEYLAEDGLWNPMGELAIKSYVSDQITLDNNIDFSGSGFVKMNSGNYVQYKNNVLKGGGNQELGNQAKITGSQKGDNGILYFVDKAILGPKNDAAKFIANDNELSEFYNLLYQAGLSDTTINSETDLAYPHMSFLQLQESWTVFAPTNSAINSARINGLIPDDKEKLKEFLLYHFVFDNVIFNDGKLSGTFCTAKIDSTGVDVAYCAPVEIVNQVDNLSVIDRKGSRVNVSNSTANNLIQFGVLHKIDNVLLEK
ncbi:MAG: hypothetical protein GXX78_01235 [Bacteroidales bacterium]|nr:hypothetical protein [Bacteroidales bacterium]